MCKKETVQRKKIPSDLSPRVAEGKTRRLPERRPTIRGGAVVAGITTMLEASRGADSQVGWQEDGTSDRDFGTWQIMVGLHHGNYKNRCFNK